MEVNKINVELDFITEQYEQQLLDFIPNSAKKKYIGRNRILRYGTDKSYGNNIVSPNIPLIFNFFKQHFDFDSVTINEYYPEQCINWHIDNKTSGKEIIVLSLLSDVDIQFRKANEVLKFALPRRSLVRFSEEIRWDWEHYVKAINKRYSIVFRNSK